MFSLGVHPHFLGACLRGVIAQRLLRTLCPACKQTFDLSTFPNIFDDVQRWLGPEEGHKLFAPKGCHDCHMSGYAGRTGVFELLAVGHEIRQLIFDKQPTQVIRQKTVDLEMIEFRQAALIKVAHGDSSAEEVLRVIPTEYLGLEE